MTVGGQRVSVKVKICGVTSVEDARIAVSAGANAIGVNFYPGSVRCVSAETAAAIVAVLPPSVWRVGVFVDAPRAEVEELVERCALDTVQFHGNESPDDCRGWAQRTIKAVRVKDADTLRRADAYPVDFILADAYVEGLAGGTGRMVPAEWVNGVAPARLVLAGGLTPDNVAEAIRRVRPFAVDVASGVEIVAGRKDPERVRRFIANAQTA
jgi:phosphoribosylanthranilate isomerase